MNKPPVATVDIESFAHGGEGIAHVDGRVVFVRGAIPGDTVEITFTQEKKNFARATVTRVLTPSPQRTHQRCPAAAVGAGCCDLGELVPDYELTVKAATVVEQLRHLGQLNDVPEPELVDFDTPTGWRTRMRLGVDPHGRAGLRAGRSRDVVADAQCTQAVPGLLDGIVGPGARTFRPGAELVVAIDSTGHRHVVETRKVGRGQRVEQVTSVLEGTGTVQETVRNTTFEFPATGFWQAHRRAPEVYADTVEEWVRRECAAGESVDKQPGRVVAWDLYGGVGLFVPSLLRACGDAAEVYSVEVSPYAHDSGVAALSGDARVSFVTGKVERRLAQLPDPAVVVLDPPRQGAGDQVIADVAVRHPGVVVHIGCDAATFARDTRSWVEHGYRLRRLRVFNAFPGTHHCETFGLFTPTSPAGRG